MDNGQTKSWTRVGIYNISIRLLHVWRVEKPVLVDRT